LISSQLSHVDTISSQLHWSKFVE